MINFGHLYPIDFSNLFGVHRQISHFQTKWEEAKDKKWHVCLNRFKALLNVSIHAYKRSSLWNLILRINMIVYQPLKKKPRINSENNNKFVIWQSYSERKKMILKVISPAFRFIWALSNNSSPNKPIQKFITIYDLSSIS